MERFALEGFAIEESIIDRPFMLENSSKIETSFDVRERMSEQERSSDNRLNSRAGEKLEESFLESQTSQIKHEDCWREKQNVHFYSNRETEEDAPDRPPSIHEQVKRSVEKEHREGIVEESQSVNRVDSIRREGADDD